MNSLHLLFLVPLLAYQPPIFSNFSFYTLYLLVPLAALLGRRYGVTGVVAIALGGIAFVMSLRGGGWGAVGGSPALYLIALAVVVIAAIPRPFLEVMSWPEEERPLWWLTFSSPFLLTLYIGTGHMESASGYLQLSFGFGFSLLGYFLLFVLGVRGVRVTALVIGFVAATTLSWALRVNGILSSSTDTIFLSINPLQPSMLLAAVAMIAAGATTRAFIRGEALSKFWRWPYLTVTVLAFLWFGPQPISVIPLHLEFVKYINILRVPAVLPLAAFMAGILRGARGTIFIAALVTGLTLVWVFVAQAVDVDVGQISLEAPFVAVAYALIGAKIGEVQNGATSFQMLRLPTFIFFLLLLVVGTTFKILGDGGLGRTALAVIFVAGVIAIFITVWRLLRAMAAKGCEITSEKWAEFVTILGIVCAVLANLQSVGESLKQLFILVLLPLSAFSLTAKEELLNYFGGAIDGEVLFPIFVMAVIYLLVFVGVIRSLKSNIPKIKDDTHKVIIYVKERLQSTS